MTRVLVLIVLIGTTLLPCEAQVMPLNSIDKIRDDLKNRNQIL